MLIDVCRLGPLTTSKGEKSGGEKPAPLAPSNVNVTVKADFSIALEASEEALNVCACTATLKSIKATRTMLFRTQINSFTNYI